MKLSVVDWTHAFLKDYIAPGDTCIDATAGRGMDTLFLCKLTGENGKVISFDIQSEALESTRILLEKEHCLSRCRLILDGHENMASYAEKASVSAIVFNFGYLPGGNHTIKTKEATSMAAIESGLTLLKPGGVMSLCIYSGGDSGFTERDTLLSYLKNLDSRHYLVLYTSFYNRPNNPPIPVFLIKL